VLAQRRAFRRLPSERLRSEDYWSADPHAPDSTYAVEAAVIEGYEFDRVAHKVVGSTFRSADLAHWLALDVAGKAFADAGFPDGRGLPRETTGVLLGNTLTGEFSRSNVLRLRWPYVKRVVENGLAREGWAADARQAFLEQLEAEYKSPFPPVGEESLAGGLSNTIAGRICNHFDLKGGGYTVDGACASSLLAVANACAGLSTGDLDVALAGGVDLSLDPFEIVGFAKTGALASEEMRVFDRRSSGFWPGEGCGFVVLMRHEEALAQGCRVYAVVRGWGVSSDGSGGITRPEALGQMESLRRTYRRAGFGIETVAYCEGHGTGTALGDATELEVLSRARLESKPDAPAAVVGSVKANIGHTKAAAGIAGVIKATMAVHTQVLPPATNCDQPHAQLNGPASALHVLTEAQVWPKERHLRASVSAMGFGGINAHLVLESPAAERRHALSPREQSLSRSPQDAELFLLSAQTQEELQSQAEHLLSIAARISRSEMCDLAAHLQASLKPGPVRAAIVAGTPAELAERVAKFKTWQSPDSRLEFRDGSFLGSARRLPQIAFLFPGQGSPAYLQAGLWGRRFETVRKLYHGSALPPASGEDLSGTLSTRVMQPAVVMASLAGLRVLNDLAISATAAIGHSLGELSALHWAGVLGEEALLRIARVRGAAMAELGSATGAMLAIAAPARQVHALLNGDSVIIVGYNSPRQTVVAGEASDIHRLAERAADAHLQSALLPVSHAFHTPLVAAAVPVLADQLGREDFARLGREVFSTITGKPLDEREDLRELLCQQVTSPVRFSPALSALLERGTSGDREELGRLTTRKRGDKVGKETRVFDLLIEVGPGSVLSGLIRESSAVPVAALDAGGPSLRGLLEAVGAAFALGAPVRTANLFADRFTRPFDLNWKPKFFANPCESAPILETEPEIKHSENKRQAPNAKLQRSTKPQAPTSSGQAEQTSAVEERGDQPLELVRRLVAQRMEMPADAIQNSSRMLSDLHLNSISVGQLASEAARLLGLPPLAALTEFANATIADLARALDDLKRVGATSQSVQAPRQPAGVETWFESFVMELVESGRPAVAGREHSCRQQSSCTTALAGSPTQTPEPKLLRTGMSALRNGWQVFSPNAHKLASALRQRFAGISGTGVILCIGEKPDAEQIGLWLQAARVVAAIKAQPRFVVVQHGWGAGGFARTLHLETPGLITCVVNVPKRHLPAVEWIASEALFATGFNEVFYDRQGRRREPRLKLAAEVRGRVKARAGARGLDKVLRQSEQSEMPIGARDVLLVTGGGKGIAAECALALTGESGARLAILGRSDPSTDKELAQNLGRFSAAGVRCCYLQADVTDATAVKIALREVESKLGPITAFLHGAGTNTPQLIGALDDGAFRRTLAPKMDGVRNVLAALKPERLRLFITFGSIIARVGLPGESDYATANEWLTHFTEEFQAKHPRCRCLAIEWSVWSGVGMGQRLGRVESLLQQGITPIPIDQGVSLLLDLIKRPRPAVAVVVTGRFGEPATVKIAPHSDVGSPELPLHRFLERKRVHYPGVELIVDTQLTSKTDPYLDDHVVQKQKLFPAVFGLEAMAQAAMALQGSNTPPDFEKVELTRPVGVSEKAATTIRLAALRRGPELIEVCLRSDETDYHVDHFRALCRFPNPGQRVAARTTPPLSSLLQPARLPLEPNEDLYGGILFHQGRFRRLTGYRLLKAKECLADISPDGTTVWFGPYAPTRLVLGDPGSRDAALHAIQACIPHQRLLPTGIDRLIIASIEPGPRTVRAKERSRDGNDFIYDLEVRDMNGALMENWEGLRLRGMEELPAPQNWPEPLLGPYLERRLEELAASSVKIAFRRQDSLASKSSLAQPADVERSGNTDFLLNEALGSPTAIWRRPDGKPVISRGREISAAHSSDLTLAVAASNGVACDLEAVAARSQEVWRGLLGAERFKLAERIAEERLEAVDHAATRLWTTIECLKKAGLPVDAPLVLAAAAGDGWVLLRSGAFVIATCITAVRGLKSALGIAVAFSPTTFDSRRET
jgi:enediyne polyketide synthase